MTARIHWSRGSWSRYTARLGDLLLRADASTKGGLHYEWSVHRLTPREGGGTVHWHLGSGTSSSLEWAMRKARACALGTR